MGLANRTAIADALRDAGWAPRTPAAVLIGASRPGSDEWHGTLDALGVDALPLDGDLPGIIVVGAVAGLAGLLSIEDARPQQSAEGRVASSAT
jgi:siroheme synthase